MHVDVDEAKPVGEFLHVDHAVLVTIHQVHDRVGADAQSVELGAKPRHLPLDVRLPSERQQLSRHRFLYLRAPARHDQLEVTRWWPPRRIAREKAAQAGVH